ncbi:hypothetical protein PBY51_002585 [Eleginops maclovinus]|uniref:Uncharacterized protein n=1 Tax=Eleginops maclovinus TaxID=56733 RepID=A0AAN8AKN5_ELEMC|nr:hypothetical protein PBY51_002585 [Eleginops maclovinus]
MSTSDSSPVVEMLYKCSISLSTTSGRAMIQKCSTGLVGIEDSADGSAMLRSTLLVITVAPEDTGAVLCGLSTCMQQHED